GGGRPGPHGRRHGHGLGPQHRQAEERLRRDPAYRRHRRGAALVRAAVRGRPPADAVPEDVLVAGVWGAGGPVRGALDGEYGAGGGLVAAATVAANVRALALPTDGVAPAAAPAWRRAGSRSSRGRGGPALH